MRKGFTIVELLMVIGIIAVLMGIVTTAASSSVKMSRSRRADALCTLVQSGIATYYAQYDRWPAGVDLKSRSNDEGADGRSDDSVVVLSGNSVKNMVKALVEEAKKGNPVIDVSGLWVSESDGELVGGKVRKNVLGMDFMTAVRGSKQSKRKIRVDRMYFGYPDPETGSFLRFKMTYSTASDSITVGKQR